MDSRYLITETEFRQIRKFVLLWLSLAMVFPQTVNAFPSYPTPIPTLRPLPTPSPTSFPSYSPTPSISPAYVSSVTSIPKKLVCCVDAGGFNTREQFCLQGETEVIPQFCSTGCCQLGEWNGSKEPNFEFQVMGLCWQKGGRVTESHFCEAYDERVCCVAPKFVNPDGGVPPFSFAYLTLRKCNSYNGSVADEEECQEYTQRVCCEYKSNAPNEEPIRKIVQKQSCISGSLLDPFEEKPAAPNFPESEQPAPKSYTTVELPIEQCHPPQNGEGANWNWDWNP